MKGSYTIKEGRCTTTYTCPYESLLPPHSPEELAQLRADIAAHGPMVPITGVAQYPTPTHTSIIVLDGATRVRLCDDLGMLDRIRLAPTTVGIDPSQYRQIAIKLNTHRRHLNTEARKEMVLQLAQEGKSVRQISEEAGVPKSSVADLLKANPGVRPGQVKGADGKIYASTKEPSSQAATFRTEPASAVLPESPAPPPDAQPSHPTQAPPRLSISTPVERAKAAESLFRGAGDPVKSSIEESVEAHFAKVGPLDPITLRPSPVPDVAAVAAPKAAPAIMASGFDGWNTPPDLLDAIRAFAGEQIALDPCSNTGSMVDARVSLTKEQDGLGADWSEILKGDPGLVFINPPFDQETLDRVSLHCARQESEGVESLLLVPAKTDQEWYQRAIASEAGEGRAAAICFLRGRVKYWRDGKPDQGSAFPSLLIYYGRDGAEGFCEAFRAWGACLDVRYR